MEDQFNLKKFLIENKLTNLSLREEDNDWDIEVGNEWNVQELGVGDIITPDMWARPTYWFDKVDTTIVDFSNDGAGSAFVKLEAPDNISTEEYTYKVSKVNSWLKPQYKIILPLTEQEDDEWDLEVGENWNIKDLGVGDYITPEMFNDSVFTKSWRAATKDIKIVDFFYNSLGDGFVIEYIGSSGKIEQDNINVESFNKYFLKPQYQIVPTLNEQQDDEWDIATDAFDVQELTVGDKITPNMWDKKAVIDAGEEDEFLNDEIWTINDVRNGWGIDMTSNGGGSIGWNIDDVQALLKPQYKIVAP
jgi:hypothetical protein